MKIYVILRISRQKPSFLRENYYLFMCRSSRIRTQELLNHSYEKYHRDGILESSMCATKATYPIQHLLIREVPCELEFDSPTSIEVDLRNNKKLAERGAHQSTTKELFNQRQSKTQSTTNHCQPIKS